jgi:hypothetical protein
MDGPLAFAVQDVPSEVLAFSLFITRWAEAGYKRGLKLDQSPWRPFLICCLSQLGKYCGAAGPILLKRVKRELPLVSSWSGVGEAPRRLWPQAISYKLK